MNDDSGTNSWYRQLTKIIRSGESVRKTLRVGTVALLLVGAVVAPLYGIGSSPVQEARAAGTVVADFESGDLSEWSTSYGSVVSNPVLEGDYAYQYPSGAVTEQKSISDSTPDSVGSWVYHDGTYPSTSISVADTDDGVSLTVYQDGTMYANGNSIGYSPPQNEWYRVRAVNIDWGNSNYDIKITDKDGNILHESSGHSFGSGSSTASYVERYGDASGNQYADYLTLNGAPLASSVSGTVSAQDGGTLENANITVVEDVTNGNVVAETTTNATGYWSVDLSDGDYRVRANEDGYDRETQSISVSGSDISGVDFALTPSEYYTMEFQVDDQTRTGAFEHPESLTVEREDGSTATSGFNHNESAFLGGFVQGNSYNFTLVAESNAVYEYDGFVAPGPSADYAEFHPDSIDDLATDTPTNESVNQPVNVGFSEFEEQLDAIKVTMESPEPIEEFEYTVRDSNGSAVYNRTTEFEEPTSYYQGVVSDTYTTNASQLDEPTLDYSGTYDNGTTFNGSVDFTAASGGGAFGPTGSGGSDRPGSTLAGVALLAGAGYVGYRAVGGNVSISNSVASVARRFRG